jgi:hypothetical protein
MPKQLKSGGVLEMLETEVPCGCRGKRYGLQHTKTIRPRKNGHYGRTGSTVALRMDFTTGITS